MRNKSALSVALIAMRDYQESVTTGQTHTRTDGWTDGQSDSYVPLCFAGDTKNHKVDMLEV